VPDQLSNDLASLRIDRDADQGRPRRGGWLVWVVVAAAALAAAYFVGLPALRGKFTKPAVELTEIALVSPSRASTELTASGYVIPQRVSQVSPKVGGRVTEVKIKQGDAVKKGDVLMLLDPVDLDAQIAAARARVARAQADVATARAGVGEVEQQLARERQAVASGVSGAAVAADLEKRLESQRAIAGAAAAQVRAAQAEVAALDVTRESYTVTSPLDGRIVNKPPQPGELVGPAMAGIASSMGGVEITDFDSLAVETDVPEARLALIKVGGPAEIVLDAFPDRRYRGEVMDTVPKVDRAKATVTVKIKFVDPPEGVLPEMGARVAFLSKAVDDAAVKEPPKLVVPGAAIAERGGAKVVFVLDGSKLRLVRVELGPAFGDGFVVLRGPAAGTKIVKHPAADLADGTQVKEKSGDD
jgi:RND family efflux transporter MFP subunit